MARWYCATLRSPCDTLRVAHAGEDSRFLRGRSVDRL